MKLFMISGKVNENCVVRIIQDDEFKAEKEITKGSYTIYFESDSSSKITAAVENNDGLIVGFSNIVPVEVIKSGD